jgi:hypothetical protein
MFGTSHNPKVAGSNPAPAIPRSPRNRGGFVFFGCPVSAFVDGTAGGVDSLVDRVQADVQRRAGPGVDQQGVEAETVVFALHDDAVPLGQGVTVIWRGFACLRTFASASWDER